MAAQKKRIVWTALVALVVAVGITVVFLVPDHVGITDANRARGYETRLFDTEQIHTIDIVIDDWDTFLTTCSQELYSPCNVVIDGEAYGNVGLRGSQRYSFKLEFDQYDNSKSYYGLDKLSLNNLIQDNTYMKDYLAYRMMEEFGVDAPLCSFVFITVNGEDWGLYLAVEGVEDSFLQRNYGNDYGTLYKPDSMSFGGGPGNGQDFNFEDFFGEDGAEQAGGFPAFDPSQMPEGMGDFDPSQFFGEGGMPDFDPSQFFGGEGMPDFSQMPSGMPGGFGMGSADVKLQYIDDDPDSYSNIFNNTKTDITDADKTRLIHSLKALSEGKDIESVVDTDEVLRYFVVHNFTVNGDSYTGAMIHNYYLHEQDGMLAMIPWDYNLAYGTFQSFDASGAVNDPIDTPFSLTDPTDRPMWGWIAEDEAYTEQYHALFAEFLDTVDAMALVDEAYALIAPYVERDPTAFCSYEEFETGVETLRDFCILRTESVRGQLDGAIPATKEGQSADSSSLVDASSLTLSDMGIMGLGGIMDFGGFSSGDRPSDDDASGETGFGGMPFDGQTPPEGMDGTAGSPPEMPSGMTGELPEMSDSMTGGPPGQTDASDRQQDSPVPPGASGGMRPDFSGGGFPQQEAVNTTAETGLGPMVLMGISVIVLAAGLLIAWRFKR